MKTTKYQKGKNQCYKKPMYSGAMSREFIVTSLIPRIKENDALTLVLICKHVLKGGGSSIKSTHVLFSDRFMLCLFYVTSLVLVISHYIT